MPSNKTILVLSPQSWGDMFISKHHYAMELARQGNTVYFLDPPDQSKDGKPFISITPFADNENLFIIRHRPWFPFSLKFHALPLFQWLMKGHLNRILKKTPKMPDIIWSFDLGNMYPFRIFDKKTLKIFHPVDEPLNKPAIDSAAGADVIFSVTQEILEKYHSYPAPKHFINHGVAEKFLTFFDNAYRPSSPVRVGMSGNFLRMDIDRQILLQIIEENPNVQFDCWGSYGTSQANIGGGESTDTSAFIKKLQQSPNVKLYGAISSEKLAQAIQPMDAFLICYDINKDQSKGTNYHKIMEYLATGKVIVSNNVSTYHNKPDLIQMPDERDSNRLLPSLFKKVIGSLDEYNRADKMKLRYEFAANNTYARQLTAIDNILDNMHR